MDDESRLKPGQKPDRQRGHVLPGEPLLTRGLLTSLSEIGQEDHIARLNPS